MKTVCKKNNCAGCMVCKDVCGKSAINIKDTLFAYNAIIDETKCINCNRCHLVCPQNNSLNLIYPKEWYQGWAEDEIRVKSSSGGIAAAIINTFIKTGGIVCTCSFYRGEFTFFLSNEIDDIQKYIGSKYVKSDPSGIYIKILKQLKMNKKVLFIGLPCQVAALKKYIPNNKQDNLYIIDLICHGTPSPRLLDMYLKDHGYSLKEISDIQFRRKSKFAIRHDFKYLISKSAVDKYTLAFLNGISYTENCYSCFYARTERIGDLTLGDSWGSDLSYKEKSKGISLLLCQTEKGENLINNASLHLEPVDLKNAIKHNHQLIRPSKRPLKRVLFFMALIKGVPFDFTMDICYPFKCMRQNIKLLLEKGGFI